MSWLKVYLSTLHWSGVPLGTCHTRYKYCVLFLVCHGCYLIDRTHEQKMILCCFSPPLCTLFRLNWADREQGTMQSKNPWNNPPSPFKSDSIYLPPYFDQTLSFWPPLSHGLYVYPHFFSWYLFAASPYSCMLDLDLWPVKVYNLRCPLVFTPYKIIKDTYSLCLSR